MVEKERSDFVNKTALTKMLPQVYLTCFQSQLSAAELLTLEILVWLLQAHKQVRIERLAALFPEPIKFESRRRRLQRFLILPKLSLPLLWFPLIKYILRSRCKKAEWLRVVIDRTQWRNENLFVVSVIWEKRAIPIYWQLLSKKGSSNLVEQKALLRPVFRILKGYKFIVIGDREFRSVKLAGWLNQQGVYFALRLKKDSYIQQQGAEYQTLDSLGLAPGMKMFFTGLKVTKQQGFGNFNLAAYWKRKYRGTAASNEGWYILTNLESLTAALDAYQARSGIEAMFKDCKTGGYNLEGCHASNSRLLGLVLIIAIAYSCTLLFGRTIKNMGLQKYITRLTELGRVQRRHSSFWVGLYGYMWVASMEFLSNLVTKFWQLTPNKLPNFQQGLRAMELIQSAL